MTENKAKIVTVRVEEPLHRSAKTKIAEHGTSFQDVLVDLLSAWTAGAGETYPAKHRRAHELLQEILRDGSPDQADWIVGNLKTFAEAIRLKPPGRSSKRASGG